MTGNFYGMRYTLEEHEFTTEQQALDDIHEMKKDGWDVIFMGEALSPNDPSWVVTYKKWG